MSNPPEEALATIDEMIAAKRAAIRFRDQEGKLDVRPAFHGRPIGGEHVIDLPEDREYGARHRRIGAMEQRRLDALLVARAALSERGAAPRTPDDADMEQALDQLETWAEECDPIEGALAMSVIRTRLSVSGASPTAGSEDTARLDWLERSAEYFGQQTVATTATDFNGEHIEVDGWVYKLYNDAERFSPRTLREAIDAARASRSPVPPTETPAP